MLYSIGTTQRFGGCRVISVNPSLVALGPRVAATIVAALLLAAPIHVSAQSGEDSDADVVEEIVVTGTRIKKRNLVSTSPVTQIDSEELAFQGITRVEDLLNGLPQTIADQTAWTNNGSAGTATVDLRGLQPVRTLTLLNGRRLPAGTPTNPVADINQVPGILIDRVEVLTGGASATYGSDAISGVVNFITDTDFEGIQFDYQYSLYTHENDSSIAQAVIDAGYELPSRNVSDGDTHDFSLLAGLNSPDERGNLTVYATWRDVKAVTQARRDHSACSISASSQECGGSFTIPEGLFGDFGILANPPCVMVPAPTPEDPNAMACNRIPAFDPATGAPTGEVDENGNPILVNEPELPWFGNTSGNATMTWPGSYAVFVEPGTNTFSDWFANPIFYNFAPTNYFMRPDERITAGAFGRYTFSDAVEVYLELNYMIDETIAQLAPSGTFFEPNMIYCGNPLLSQQQFDVVCGQYNLTPDDFQWSFIGRRNAEGGPRRSEQEHEQHRVVLGVRGDLGASWSYDAYANYGKVEHSELFDEDLSITRMIRAIDVVADPVSGAPVCRSVLDGSDAACVPWNIFESGAVTEEAIAYITQPLFFEGSTRQVQLNGFVSGDLGDYGLRLPGADDGIKAVFGLEYRDEQLGYEPDPAALTGDVAGFGANVTAIDAGYSVSEFFTEASVPILEGRTAAELVSVDIAYRYSDYSTGKTTNTYKYAGEWMIHPSLRLRASFQRAVRVGNVNELFRPLQDSFGEGGDTCIGQNPESSLEECQRTGLSAAQYGALPPLPEGLNPIFQTQFGGNPDLDPEESDTVSFGFILTPELLPELTLSVDYYDIDVQGAIAEPSSKFVFDQCIATGLARFCDAVNRDPVTGFLDLGDGYVDVRNTNIGAITTKGVDVVADYVIALGASDLQFNLVGTWLESWEWQELPGETPFECAGTYNNGPCSRPRPELATNLRTTWITPWDASISLLWRYYSDIQDGGQFGYDLPSTDYFDLSGVWDITDQVTLRFGIKNLFDDDPPLSPVGNSSSGNTIPGVYDALGRYWFAGVNVRL